MELLRSRFESIPGAFNACLIPTEQTEKKKKRGLKATFSRRFDQVLKLFLMITIISTLIIVKGLCIVAVWFSFIEGTAELCQCKQLPPPSFCTLYICLLESNKAVSVCDIFPHKIQISSIINLQAKLKHTSEQPTSKLLGSFGERIFLTNCVHYSGLV